MGPDEDTDVQVYFDGVPLTWYPKWKSDLEGIVDKARAKLNAAMKGKARFVAEFEFHCDHLDKLIEIFNQMPGPTGVER